MLHHIISLSRMAPGPSGTRAETGRTARQRKAAARHRPVRAATTLPITRLVVAGLMLLPDLAFDRRDRAVDDRAAGAAGPPVDARPFVRAAAREGRAQVALALREDVDAEGAGATDAGIAGRGLGRREGDQGRIERQAEEALAGEARPAPPSRRPRRRRRPSRTAPARAGKPPGRSRRTPAAASEPIAQADAIGRWIADHRGNGGAEAEGHHDVSVVGDVAAVDDRPRARC